MKQELYNQQKTVTTANSNTTVTANIDTLGFHQAVIDLAIFGAATTNQPAALSISECDTSNGTFVAINKLSVGAATDNVQYANALLTAATADNTIRWNVDLRGRKRYLQTSLTLNTAQATTVATTVLIVNLLGAGDVGTETTQKQNVQQLIDA